MLQNEPPRTSAEVQSAEGKRADVPASQRDVTPQELTRALASLRAQKEEAARRQEELSRGPTPEKIWAEVVALRAQDDAVSARSAVAFPASPSSASPSSAFRTDTRPRDRLQKKTLLWVALACAAAAALLLSSSRRPALPGFRGRPVLPFASRQALSADPFAMTAPDAEFYRKLNRSQGPHPQYRIRLRLPWAPPRSGAVRGRRTRRPIP